MEFLSRYKKALMILGFIFVILFLGYLLYSMFFKPVIAPSPQTNEEQKNNEITGGLQTADTGQGNVISTSTAESLPVEKGLIPQKYVSDVAKGGLTKTNELSQSSVLNPTMSGNGSDLQYYDQNDGKFYKIDNNGDAVAISDKVFHNVNSVTWSPDKNKAILEYPDGANIVYDFKTNTQVTLPSHWKDFDFSPDGNQIVMKSMGLDPSNRWLAVTNVDGSKTKAIESLGDKDSTVYPSWSPNKQVVAMYSKGIDFNRQEVFFVGLNDENFKSTVVEGRGFIPAWSPAGDRLLYSVYSSDNQMKPELWIVNAQGDNIGSNRKDLNIQTWADKCTFANSTDLYCAVPKSMPEGAGLFPELGKNTVDELYKIDTKTGIKKLIATPDGDYNMNNLMISDNGYYAYFTDSATGHLYKIKLK